MKPRLRLAIAALVLLLPSPAFAEWADVIEGCLDAATAFASDTEYSKTQTFMLSVTTSACLAPAMSTTVGGGAGIAAANAPHRQSPDRRPDHIRQQAAFAAANYASLRHNAAAGGGEFLTAYARLFGCADAALPVFVERAQHSYQRLFGTYAASHDLPETTRQLMREDPTLLRSCVHL